MQTETGALAGRIYSAGDGIVIRDTGMFTAVYMCQCAYVIVSSEDVSIHWTAYTTYSPPSPAEMVMRDTALAVLMRNTI